MGPSVYQVSEFTREVRAVLEGRFSEIWITGEVSNLATPASGHIYFSLKDDRAQIRCAMFRSRRLKYSGDLDDGAAVLVRGKVSIYEPRGDFQLIVDYIEPAGEGELRRKFELLKARLDNEGLFDPAQRRALPALPRRVGLITSSQGAAVRDVLSTLARRFPLADVDLHPVMVQGETAAPQIAQALAKMG
ncbi:MAG: exodeoxyribonuclease VII large subunit, partial [Proteobacteria bacterium]|nr:exodeoxyribonuclease VII large subunit [Pseudomonadota bacterium]